MASGFVGMLEADLRNLSAEARKPEPGLVGYFGGTAHPEVKEAAERAILKLRSLDQNNLNAVTISFCDVRCSLDMHTRFTRRHTSCINVITATTKSKQSFCFGVLGNPTGFPMCAQSHMTKTSSTGYDRVTVGLTHGCLRFNHAGSVEGVRVGVRVQECETECDRTWKPSKADRKRGRLPGPHSEDPEYTQDGMSSLAK
eukprot:7352536-Pyramimonas_sp.AAC.1